MPSAPRLLVEVTPALISVANRGVERAELWGALEAARGDFADPRRVVLAIDQATTWDRIEPVLETLGAVGFTTVELILTTPAAPPPRTPIDDAFDAVEARDDPSTRASAFAKVVGEEAKRCPALVALFGGAVTSGDVGAHIATGAPEALLACDCAVAPATMRSIAWRTLGNPRPIGILALQLDRTAGSPTFPPRATWADASKQLEPGRIWFGRR
jgi:hypothetical protein